MSEHIPETGLRVPSTAPPAVAEKRDTYQRLVGEYRETSTALKAAKAEVDTARKADIEAFTAAAVAGKDADTGERERAARQNVADLQHKLDALGHAVDRAGTELLAAIDEHRAEWTASNEAEATKARAEYDAALNALRASLDNLSEAFATQDWLTASGFYADLKPEQRQSFRPARAGSVQLRPGDAPVRVASIVDALARIFTVEGNDGE